MLTVTHRYPSITYCTAVLDLQEMQHLIELRVTGRNGDWLLSACGAEEALHDTTSSS